MSADLSRVFETGEQVKRWAAERENASARHDLAKMRHASATLLSRADPVSHLDMNREHLRVLLAFLQHNDLPRLMREVQNVAPEPVVRTADSSADLDVLLASNASLADTGMAYAEEVNALRARSGRYEQALRTLRRIIRDRHVALTPMLVATVINEALDHADK